MIRIAAVAFILLIAGSSFAQDWIEYRNLEDRFAVNLPGQPTIREITYQSQRAATLEGRVYEVLDGPRRYSVTVIDYTGARGDVTDWLGSVAWEAWRFRKRGGEVTYDAYAQVDRIVGHQIHITNPDKTLTYAAIHLHGRRLYVLEATVPPGTPGAVHFQQSLQILDETGKAIRYELDDDGNRVRRVR